jgi:hypothetical protein
VFKHRESALVSFAGQSGAPITPGRQSPGFLRYPDLAQDRLDQCDAG